MIISAKTSSFSSSLTALSLSSSSSLSLRCRFRPNNTFVVSLATKCHSLSSSSSSASPLALWTVSEIAEAVDGTIVRWGCPGPISTDTRTIEPNHWFFAITGQNFDAHDFITLQLSHHKQCSGVIAQRVCENWDKGFVQLHPHSHPLASLTKMAIYARNKFPADGALVGVTGSVGKTTTREMIALLLQNLGLWVHQSFGNLNTQIGVALTLIGAPRNAGSGFAVLEMGMSGKGEILELARMARPTIRVILNVGLSHFASFESLEEVAMAKGEILVEAKPGDVCVLNADDPLVMSLPVPHGVKRVLFGRSMESDIRLVVAESTNGGLGVRVVLERNKDMVEFVIPCPGLHLAMNACAAAAVATLLGVSLPQVAKSLSNFSPMSMRSQLEVARNGMKIINDVYNANPVSTKAALDLLRSIDCKGKRVAILGDMLELGQSEMKSHETILSLCCNADISLIGLVGKRFRRAAYSMHLGQNIDIVLGDDADDLVFKIAKRLRHNDVVLVKGSRGMQMERVVDAIKSLHM